MKQHPILFSTPMVQAILEGRKTQTRRIIKACLDDRGLRLEVNGWEDWHGAPVRCPYGQPGDVLWVRETWKSKYVKDGLDGFRLHYPDVHPWFYAADGESKKGYGSWKPSIHMPYDACRLFLKITDVRVERLQDIMEEDAISEGIEYIVSDIIRGYRDYTPLAASITDAIVDSPINSFRSLWRSINGTDSWQTNPWVWAVSFERVNC